MCLAGRLSPEFEAFAAFRHNKGKAIRNVCSKFIVQCRTMP